MPIAIKAENISKAYQLGEIGTGTLSRDLERWYHRLRGKEDPFLKIGETNDRTKKGTSDIVWSLKDINFEIEQGDAVGIIGRNGAGKSTLLKVLSRVTSPTTGTIKGKGRIASLLEVGTGFHPELTGGENIYLNGAILGMRKSEITRKFEEIVEFAGVARYIETPVKRYSSGMYVRLAFAVAAHLESEILIIDEVLAVGDVEFQKKCLGKMGEVSKGEGRTVLFVSHNMNSIQNLCTKGILLENGMVTIQGNVSQCIKKYNATDDPQSNDSTTWVNEEKKYKNDAFFLHRVSLVDRNYNILQSKEPVCSKKYLALLIEGEIKTIYRNLKIGYELRNEEEDLIMTSLTTDNPADEWLNFKEGENKIVLEIPVYMVKPGRYTISVYISLHYQYYIVDPKFNEIKFNIDVENPISTWPYWIENENGPIVLPSKGKLIE